MRALVLLGLALWFGACSPASEQSPPARAFSSDTATIFAADSPEERLLVCQADRRHQGRWTPAQEEINALEPVLIELLEYKLAENRLSYGDPFELEFSPTDYRRHYFGLVRGDRRFILICGRHGEEPVYMHDGGASRFAALYDAQYRTFTWFEFGYRA